MTCLFCGNALPWSMGPTTCAHCSRFQHMDVLSMQREYNRVLSQQADLLRLIPVPRMSAFEIQDMNEAAAGTHWFAPGAAVCNCGERRFEDAPLAAPPGWPREQGTTPCNPSSSQRPTLPTTHSPIIL